MSYFSQMVGLTARNFLAGAAGLAVGIAFIRGLARQQTEKLGNFWVDLTRAVLWVLLPLSVAGGLILVWQGVPMNFSPYTKVTTVEGVTQIIAQGAVRRVGDDQESWHQRGWLLQRQRRASV